MKARTLSIRGLDTALFRDGRPFDTTPGSVAAGLTVPFPSTLAGFLRTQAGGKVGDYDKARPIQARGPLLCRDGEVLLPAPADAVPFEKDGGLQIMRLRPFTPPDGAGCDAPGDMKPLWVTEDLKPQSGHEWWPLSAMLTWLGDGVPTGDALPRYLKPELDERVHVTIEKETGVAEEGKLFTTRMVAFERFRDGLHVLYSYLVRTFEPDEVPVPLGPGLLGGEQRIGLVEEASVDWPTCPPDLAETLKTAKYVRLVLATPAIFERGWVPGWLDRTSKEGSPPGCEGLKLKLVSAAVPRRQAVSGWEYGTGTGRPKPVRWLAPAGSVYFFEVVEGDPAALATEGWLAPVSDGEQPRNGETPKTNDRDDGFGLALWGVWAPEDTKQ